MPHSPKGRVARAVECFTALYQTPDRERTSAYHRLAEHIASLSLGHGRTIGELDFLSYTAAERWFRMLQEKPTVLSTLLALDAIDKLANWTAYVDGYRERGGVSPGDKKEITGFLEGVAVEFRVPEGCLWLRHVRGEEDKSLEAGFTGYATIQRCHLSQSVYFQPYYLGIASYQRRGGYFEAEVDQSVGFSLPCWFHPESVLDGKGELMVKGSPLAWSHNRGVHVLIPFGWVTRAFAGGSFNEPWTGWVDLSERAIETTPSVH